MVFSTSLKVRTALVAAGACLAVASCGSTASDSDHKSTSAPTSHSTPPDPPTSRDSSAPAATTPGKTSGAIAASSTLKCAEQIGPGPPPDSLEIVGGVVALPVATKFGPIAAGMNQNHDGPRVRHFAKQPLTIRTGRTFDLVVPPKERDRLAIGWGNNPTDYTWRLHVSCTDANAKWLTFAGGYFTPRRECVSLIVRVDDKEHRVRIGAGARCTKH